MSDRVEQMENILKERGMEILFARVASNLLQNGNIEEAINVCENGLKKFPYYAQAHYVLATCYLKKDRQSDARNELERTLKYDPNHLRALKFLAELYRESGMEEPFKEKMQKLQYLDPLNQEIKQMAKNLGIYAPWPAVVHEKGKADDIETVVTKIAKMDLSQFDNRDDDFGTIISGKKPTVNEEENKNQEPKMEEKPDNLENGSEKDDKLDYEELDELKFDEGESKEAYQEDRWVRSTEESEFTEVTIQKSGGKKPESGESLNDDLVSKDQKNKSSQTDKIEENDVLTQPKIVSQTLGEILVSQKKYTQALKVFELLKDQHPENKSLEKKIAFLKKIILLEQK